MKWQRFRFRPLAMAGLAVLFGSVLAVVLGLHSKPGTINPDNYEKITIGMTLEEVEGILGKLDEKGNRFEGITLEEVKARPRLTETIATVWGPGGPGWTLHMWVGPRYAIVISADADKRVGAKYLVRPKEPGLWERVKQWLSHVIS